MARRKVPTRNPNAIRFVFAAGVSISKVLGAAPVEGQDDTAPRWVQIATEGDYPGYRNGEQPFSLTRETFQQIIANLHANPSYKVGADGVGDVDVIPWDFHHASELYPGDGTIPTAGAPAQAWTREMEIRDSAEGKAELWGLTRFLDLARGYIRGGQYQWASVAVTFNSIDPASARNVGAVLTSVAMTNNPIVRGMQKLVASAGPVAASHYWVDPADGVDEALEGLKDLLGLPKTADLAVLTGELAKLQSWAGQGMAPPGIDVDDIFSTMRRLFNLPALSTVQEVLDEANKVITRSIEDQVGQSAAPMPPAPEAAATAATAMEREQDMELLKTLASRLGVREADATVQAAVDELATLRTGIQKLLGADSDAVKALLEGVERSVSARTRLTALLKALGVEDVDTAVNQVADLMAKAKELSAVMPELVGLKARVQEQDNAVAEAEVDGVIASRGYDVALKDALLLQRKSDPEKFALTYPPAAPGDQALLGSVVLARSPGKGAPVVAGQGKQPVQAALLNQINLATYPGRNTTERAMAYLCATVEGAKDWTHEARFVAACNLKKQPNVVDEQAA